MLVNKNRQEKQIEWLLPQPKAHQEWYGTTTWLSEARITPDFFFLVFFLIHPFQYNSYTHRKSGISK